MPGPPPNGVSSTEWCGSCVHVLRSCTPNSMSPRCAALPMSETPSGAKYPGKMVMMSIRTAPPPHWPCAAATAGRRLARADGARGGPGGSSPPGHTATAGEAGPSGRRAGGPGGRPPGRHRGRAGRGAGRSPGARPRHRPPARWPPRTGRVPRHVLPRPGRAADGSAPDARRRPPAGSPAGPGPGAARRSRRRPVPRRRSGRRARSARDRGTPPGPPPGATSAESITSNVPRSSSAWLAVRVPGEPDQQAPGVPAGRRRRSAGPARRAPWPERSPPRT